MYLTWWPYAPVMRELSWSRAAVGQAVALAGPHAAVRHISALAGGTHARTYLIQTANPELEVVLREFPAGDAAACQEAQVLTALDGLGGLAPRLLASGPRGFDVGWCRLDLYLLYDQRIADCFLDAYQAASGNTLTGSLLWDLWAVAWSYRHVESWAPNYHDLSRSDLTATELRKRHTQWSRYLLGQSTNTAF